MVGLSSLVPDYRHGRQIAIVATIVLALALGGIIAILLAGLTMNRDAARTQTQLLDNAISQVVVDALNGVQTVAFWDTTVKKLQSRKIDERWLDNEIGDYLTKVYGHESIWILDPKNRPIYGFTGGHRIQTASLGSYGADVDKLVRIVRSDHEDGRRIRDASFRNNQSRYTEISRGGAQGRWTSHVIGSHGQVVVLSAMSVVPVTDQKILRGRPYLIISAVRIDKRRLRNFADSLLIRDLRATSVTAPATSSGQFVVTTDAGQSIQRFQWSARQPGRFLLHYVLPLFIVITWISASLLVLTLRRIQRMTTSLVNKEQEANFLADYDPLSELPNRRLFAKRLDAALTPELLEQYRTTLAFCDIDDFKTINDTLGHESGDLLIKEVARRLRSNFPECVLVSRFGGDEFALMHSASWLSVSEFGERIQNAFEEPIDLSGTPTRIGISVGISIAPDHGHDATDLMRNADIALYDAKDAGRARCTVYDQDMREQIFVRKEREARILAMLEADRFELHYQPIVDVRMGRVSGMEALLRWPSDDPSPMHPVEFIPIAEGSGTMLKLGDWVIRRAFNDSLRWPDLWISINLSPLQIKAPELLGTLAHHLRISGADPTRIVFEITEGLLLESSENVRAALKGISAMGFKMGLDDFGTGYSSLSYLQEFTFDKLKIDRSFISDGKLEEQRSASLVKAVIDVGRALGIEVVAEGVEHLKEALILKVLGCDQIQGWLYGRAMPPAEATKHLQLLTAELADAPGIGAVPTLRLAIKNDGP